MVASKALKALACCRWGLASEMWRVGVVFVCVCGGGGGRSGRKGGEGQHTDALAFKSLSGTQ